MSQPDFDFGSPFCPKFHHAVELIGRRWSGAILRALFSGAQRYSDIAAAVPGLSDRLLSERLRELEAEGVLKREVIPDMPVRIHYSLTEKGLALRRVFIELADWADIWIDGEEAAAACEAHASATAGERLRSP